MKLRWHIKFEIATGLVGLLPVIDPRRWERAAVAFAAGDRGLLSPEKFITDDAISPFLVETIVADSRD